jgi:putative aldouronate transport system substrate-binding protein
MESIRKRAAGGIILLLLAGVLAWSGGQVEPASGKAAVALSAPGQYPVVKDKINLTFLAQQEVYIENWATNEFTKHMEQLTNIHIDWKTMPSTEEAISLALASGDFPDAFFLGWTCITDAQLEQYGVQDKAVLALDDLIAKHMPNLVKALDAIPNGAGLVKSSDGKTYSLPKIDVCQHCQHSGKMWVNQPWLDKLGLKKPTTTEEFYQMLKAFKQRDPNGNGKADEIPFIACASGGWQQQVELFLLNSFVYYNHNDLGFYVDKGKVESVLATPAYKAGLQYLNKLYKEGLIYEGSFTQDGSVVKKIVENDIPIVGAGPAGTSSMFVTQLGNERYRMYRPIAPLKGPQGFQNAPFLSWPITNGGMVLSKKNPYPEATVKWADYLYTTEGTLWIRFGKPGSSWRWAEAGEKGYDGQPAVWKQLRAWTGNFVQNETTLQNGVWNMSPDFRPGAAADTSVDLYSAVGQELQLYLVTKELYRPHAHNDMALPPLKFSSSDTMEVAMLATELDKLYHKAMFDFITGNLSFDADWPKYLESLDRAGVGRLKALYQKAYDAAYK